MNDGHVATATVIPFPTQYTAARGLRPPSRRPAGRQAAGNQPGFVRPSSRRTSAKRPPRGCAAEPPLRLTRRGRVVVVAVAAVVICALLSLVLATASATAGPGERPRLTHVVQPGETLWSVALGVDENSDTRDVVDRLVDLNGLTSLDLQPGQALLLPTADER